MRIRPFKFLISTMALSALVAFALPAFSASEAVAPTLSINIPTVNFSRANVSDNSSDPGFSGYIDIPWIAQYANGVYSYSIGVAGLLAGVMIVIGGFYYLTAGGDASRVQKGKQKISDAIIGLVLVFLANLILTTVSPQLTTFEPIRIKRIRSSPYALVTQSLMTTTHPTGEDHPGGGSTGTPRPFTPPPGAVDAPNTPLPPPSGNNYVPLYTTCPVTAQIPPKNGRPCTASWARSIECGEESPTGPRGTAFRDAMRALIANEPNARRKIAMVAEAGVKCVTHYGSCGATAVTWTQIALGGTQLGANDPGQLGNTRWEGVNHETPSALAWPLLAVACDTVCSGSQFRTTCGDRCDPATRPNGTVIPNSYKVVRNCFSGAAARAEVRRMFEGPGGPAGWPDSWTSRLEIGDQVNIFNGNSSCGASHALIFLGWTSNGRAKMANGQWGGPQWIDERCLMRSCGNFQIVTRIYKPRSLISR